MAQKTKKMQKSTSELTEEEKSQIFSAASRTWQAIASDAAQMGATTINDAIELVFDADRVVDVGRLDPMVAKKFLSLDIAIQDKFLKKNRNRWF